MELQLAELVVLEVAAPAVMQTDTVTQQVVQILVVEVELDTEAVLLLLVDLEL